MPLFTTKKLLDTANSSKERFAVPAINVHNMEYTKGVIAAAEELKSPVILMLGQPILKFAGLNTLANITMFAAKNASVPVAVMLDHGSDSDYIQKSIDLGLSIMVDGSHHDFEGNIALTKRFVDIAHKRGLSVEGELGAIGGSEDGEEERKSLMTNPNAAVEFVKRTGVDILAVSIGNIHGLYKGTANIDVNRLVEIKKKIDIPLVMHGGSDLPVDVTKELIENGIAKFNVGTDIKITFSLALREALSTEPIRFQPFDSLQYAMDKVKEKAIEKILLLKADGKAKLY